MWPKPPTPINLTDPLSLRTSFAFPLQHKLARREVFLGGFWLLVPVIGWLLNMGHRIQMVHQMMQGKPAWPAWPTKESGNYPQLLKHGLVTFAGMLYYYLPSGLLAYWYYTTSSILAIATSVTLFLLATLAIPGYMSHYCLEFRLAEIFNPALALSRVLTAGPQYWKAWLVAMAALLLSFLGLLGLGIGFLFTSVWFWQVAGFSFATVMSQQYALKIERTTRDNN